MLLLALIQVETPIPIEEDNKARVCLPDTKNPIPEDQKGCYGTGWGFHKHASNELADILKQVRLNLMTRSDCNSVYRGSIKNGQICAGDKEGGKDTCANDSGGPLVCQKNGKCSFSLYVRHFCCFEIYSKSLQQEKCIECIAHV